MAEMRAEDREELEALNWVIAAVERKYGRQPYTAPAPPAVADVQEFAHEIDALLDSGDADWAEETLSGIRDTVMARGEVTDNQRRAVNNIASAVDRRRR